MRCREHRRDKGPVWTERPLSGVGRRVAAWRGHRSGPPGRACRKGWLSGHSRQAFAGRRRGQGSPRATSGGSLPLTPPAARDYFLPSATLLMNLVISSLIRAASPARRMF